MPWKTLGETPIQAKRTGPFPSGWIIIPSIVNNMLKQLNGWQRMGVLVSLAWVGYGLYHSDEKTDAQIKRVWAERGQCLITAQQDEYDRKLDRQFQALKGVPQSKQNEDVNSANERKCDATEADELHSIRSNEWPDAWAFALLPVVLGWVGAYTLIAAIRWIIAGFRASSGS